MTDGPFNIPCERWRELDTQQRRLLQGRTGSVEDQLRRGQRLSAQAAALRRSIVRDESPARRP